MKRLLIIAAFALLPLAAWSQGRFDASVFAGLNMCQVDGDNAGHYNHLGLRAGIGTSFALGRDVRSPWRMVVEVAYTQKGSEMAATDGRISLQYVEVPLLLAYEAMDGALRLAGGIAPAVKVGSSVTFGGIENASQNALYRVADWLPLTFDARYAFAQHLAFYARWQMSVISIYDGAGPYRIFRSNHGAFNRLLSFGLAYKF